MRKQTVGKILLGLVAAFLLATGTVNLLVPERAASSLMLDPQGVEGLSNVRAFLGAPLIGLGGSLLVAAITARLDHARAAAMFVLTLLAGRLLGLLVDGGFDALGLYLAVPTGVLATMIVAHKLIESPEDAPASAPRAASAAEGT